MPPSKYDEVNSSVHHLAVMNSDDDKAHWQVWRCHGGPGQRALLASVHVGAP